MEYPRSIPAKVCLNSLPFADKTFRCKQAPEWYCGHGYTSVDLLPCAEDDAVSFACADEGEFGGVENVEVAAEAWDHRGAAVALNLEWLERSWFQAEALVPACGAHPVRFDSNARDEFLWWVAFRLMVTADFADTHGVSLAALGRDVAAHGVSGVGVEPVVARLLGICGGRGKRGGGQRDGGDCCGGAGEGAHLGLLGWWGG